MARDPDIKDAETCDLYVAMLKAVSKIEATGELDIKDVENLDLRAWVWLQEYETKKEMV